MQNKYVTCYGGCDLPTHLEAIPHTGRQVGMGQFQGRAQPRNQKLE